MDNYRLYGKSIIRTDRKEDLLRYTEAFTESERVFSLSGKEYSSAFNGYRIGVELNSLVALLIRNGVISGEDFFRSAADMAEESLDDLKRSCRDRRSDEWQSTNNPIGGNKRNEKAGRLVTLPLIRSSRKWNNILDGSGELFVEISSDGVELKDIQKRIECLVGLANFAFRFLSVVRRLMPLLAPGSDVHSECKKLIDDYDLIVGR